AELVTDLVVRSALRDALHDETVHLACARGRRVLHRQALTGHAAELAGDPVDALRGGRIVWPRAPPRRSEDRDERDQDQRAFARHRVAFGRSPSIAVTSVASSIGPMCRPAMMPSGAMKYVSGGPNTPYAKAIRPSSSCTVGHVTPFVLTYARAFSVESP